MRNPPSVPARTFIRFDYVPEHQGEIHARLENWARWARGSQGRDNAPCSPMFALYRATEANRMYGSETPSSPLDKLDAAKVQKAVSHLPEKHRASLNWAYLKPVAPIRAARAIAVSLEGLAELLTASRQMLINRRV